MKKELAITAAVFDCLHEGHVNLLKKMRRAGKRVVVFLHDDLSTFKNKGRFTVQDVQHRANNLGNSGLVDEVVFVKDQNPGEVILAYFRVKKTAARNVVYMRGDDWEDFPGREAVERLGFEIRIIPYTKGVSTTQIRKELKQ